MITKNKIYPIDDDGYLLGAINRSTLLHCVDLDLIYGSKL